MFGKVLSHVCMVHDGSRWPVASPLVRAAGHALGAACLVASEPEVLRWGISRSSPRKIGDFDHQRLGIFQGT